jgi:hypothetical protein
MMAANATSTSLLDSLGASLALISVAVAGTAYLVYRLDLSTGSIKRRVRALEVGWKE